MAAPVLDARQIFLEAVEKHAPEGWPEFLDSACGGDAPLRQRVEALLQAHGQYNDLLDGQGFVATVEHPVSERPGLQIGPYKLLQQIGEGGFGVVFMAEQLEPVRRRVAVKVIKPGMDTRQVIARFEAERQALAVMDHPHIARVLDAGATESGRPYFVMELVRGVPITAYCDDSNLPVRERLALFAAVCQAIQHAHTKGIIHRDIKPSNVLVTQQDGQPAVKVIDFGIAKAMGQQLTDKTLFTDFAQMIGTPLYMSPEQAELSGSDIDTRSDIYSLGVLLYELLTGSTPVSKEQLQQAAFDEIRRIIREDEAERPSNRISTAEAAPSIAAQRHTEPAKLARLVRGELDWIVMKALEKDRSRRYETATGLAADVERYLHDEPVLACPPAAMYRFGKFARRNKGGLLIASVIALALLLTVGSFGWMVRDREAGRARTAGEVNLFLQRAELLYAESKLAEAAGEVQKARGVLAAGGGDDALGRRVQQWQTDLDTAARFEALRRQHPDITDREQVNAGYAQVFRQYGIDVEALSVEEAAARIARSRIMFELTVALDTWAWRLQISPQPGEPAHPQRLRTIQRAADPDPWRQRLHRAADTRDLQALRAMAEEVDVERFHIRTLALLGTKLTECNDPETGVAVLRRAQRQHPGSFLMNEVLARCLMRLKPTPWQEVIEYRRVALALSPASPAAHLALGEALSQEARSSEAIAEFREAIRLQPESALTHEQLGWTLLNLEQFPEAEAAFREAVRLDPERAAAYRGLARAIRPQSKSAEAIEQLRESIRLQPTHPGARVMLGWMLVDQKQLPAAEEAFRAELHLNPESIGGYAGLGRTLVEQEEFAEAEAVLRQAFQRDPEHPGVRRLLARALAGQSKSEEAQKLSQQQTTPQLPPSEDREQPM